jgi:DNA-binding CsgD family transcriptional regulator
VSADPADRLVQARSLLADLRPDEAWAACAEVAEHARSRGDAALLADAATALRGLDFSPIAEQVHRLCLEALALLSDQDPVRAERVRAQRDATRSPWREPVAPVAESGADAESRLLALHARHRRHLHVSGIEERLAAAGEALAMAEASGSAEEAAYGHLWRIEALGQLGRRVELDGDLAGLRHAVRRLGQPVWEERLGLVRASLFLLEGRFADCAAAVAAIRGFLGLVIRSQLAVLSGDGLEGIEREVRAALDGTPFFARTWHALLLTRLGRRDEAAALWRAIAPHVRDVPPEAPEWIVAAHGHATLCAALGDTEVAPVLHEQLSPWAELQVLGGAETPHHGPVALALGRLDLLLGRTDAARDHLGAALGSAERMHALPYVGWAHLELARLDDGGEHLAEAKRLAERLGMAPLVEAVVEVAADRASTRRGLLSPRETEVVGLVAQGLSNRVIATRLHLSERTVENHVSHAMRKLSLTSRTGLAAWFSTGAQVPR